VRRVVRRLEALVAPSPTREGELAVGERVITWGIALSVAGLLIQTAMHLTNFVVFDGDINGLDADEDFSAASWAGISATFVAGTGALLLGLVLRRGVFYALAGLFTYLSFDDFMRVHERVAELGTVGIGKEEELGRVIWPLLFMPLLVAGAALIWIAANQFSGRASWLIRGGLLLLVSAVVLEASSAVLFQLGYEQLTWPYQIEVVLEEGCELVGWTWIATALLAVACIALDGRHASITNAAAGVAPAALMARARHSDFKTTQVYIDLAGETFREEAERLERLFGQKSGQK
jgi:hypothetical protein